MPKLKILNYVNAITINRRYNTSGHSPILVTADDFNTYVVKFIKTSFDKHSITKEFLCSHFLTVWYVNAPTPAAVKFSNNILEQNTVNLTLKEQENMSKMCCFGSRFIPRAIDLSNILSFKYYGSYSKIKNPDDIFKIGLFDIWVENDDRKDSNNNLLLYPTGKCLAIYPIDHAYTFSTMPFSDLHKGNNVSFSYNDSILHSDFAKHIIKKTKINQVFYDKLKKNFYLCIHNTEENLPLILQNIPKEYSLSSQEVDDLKSFLFNKNRNQAVFEEFVYILEKIKK